MTRKAVIVDDERLARKRLRELLTPYPEIEVVGEADSVESAELLVREHQPEVIFLDVEMPPESGFDLLPLIADVPRTPEIVFVTAYENFALRAFDVSARDYLLKPIHPNRLALTLEKLWKVPNREAAPVAAVEEEWTLESKVTLSDRKVKCVVEVGMILIIHALGAYSRVSLRGQPAIIVLRSISEWEKRLPASEFCRADRSLIVQAKLIRTMRMISRDETEITLNGFMEPLAVGRTATARLKRLLNRTVD